MKKVYFITAINILVLLTGLLVSCNDTTLKGTGLKEKSWSNDKTYSISEGQTLKFTFNASSTWTASSDSPALLTLSAKSGGSGANTLEVTATGSSQEESSVTIRVNGYTTESIIRIQFDSSTEHKDDEVNNAVDQYLKKMYLWNDEYKELSPDFSLAYDDFLEKTLMSMTTNTLDKR